MASWLNQARRTLGDTVSGLGYAASAATKRNIQITPGGLGSKISQVANPFYVQTARADYTPPPPPRQELPRTGPGDVLGANTYGGGGMPSNPVTQQQQQQQQPYQQIQQQQDNGNAQIDADYNSAMSMLGGAEEGLRGQASTAEGQITNEAAKTQTTLGEERATREQGVQSSLSTAEKQGTSAMQQARDLFRQTQQGNIAQLSALGISSSSVAEALAERLGVETARRIAGVTGSLDEARLNATKELGRVKDYYAQRVTQLQTDAQLQKQQIQQSLMSGLQQINSAKSQAASDKAQARSNLLQQVSSQIYSLQTQQQQFEQSLKLWAEQKQAALTPIVQDPNYLNTLMSTANTFNQQFAPTGFAFTPEVSFDQYGQMKGKIVSNKKPDEDPLAELYRQAGVTPGDY